MIDLYHTLIDNYGNAPNVSELIPGKIIRFASSDKKHSKSCWVRVLGEHLAFHSDWRLPDKPKVWSSEKHKRYINSMSSFERNKYYEKLQQQKVRIEEQTRNFKLGYIKELWESYQVPAYENSYFVKKQIKVLPDMKMDGKDVLIPMYGNLFSKQIVGIQHIFEIPVENKTKKFAFNSMPSESFYPIKSGNHKLNDSEMFFICEGYATAYSSMQLIKDYDKDLFFTVFVSFNDKNMQKISKIIKDLFPDRILLSIADGDRPGYIAAKKCLEYGANGFLDICNDDCDINDDYIANKEELLEKFSYAMFSQL